FGDGMTFFGRYIEVTPPSLIVWTNEEAGADSSITTVTFEELDDRRTLVVMTEEFPSKEACDAAGTGAADATHETFDQLDELLIELA
ncbi:MAG: SRPBCC domain-containing protein, partial [Microthrixaceae bacterium]|nr:SRPBCC domain-containing protein [Microthrixaceae bacterium]